MIWHFSTFGGHKLAAVSTSSRTQNLSLACQ